MTYQNLSKRQSLAMMWWIHPKYNTYDGIICDGSIRSGKTVSMSVGFVLWAMRSFDGGVFALCGKTIESLRRNVVFHLPDWLSGIVSIRERRSENKLIISVGDRVNTFYLFGGRDESSYALIQGITLSGVLFDEVALMPRSFVEQAMARCSVEGSKFWFNCNPEGPTHWFFQEWVQKSKHKNMLHLHFTMADNPSLSVKIRKRYEKQYSGIFYERYIRGLWVYAEGLIYSMFSRVENVFAPADAPQVGEYYVSIDYGIKNPFSAGLWCVNGRTAYRVAEYYYDGRKKGQRTDEEHADALIRLVAGKSIRYYVVDPSASSIIVCLKRRGLPVIPAQNEVLPGISDTATLIGRRQLKVSQACSAFLTEVCGYVWDNKAVGDKPIKDNDHTCDDTRYFVHTILRRMRHFWL